jgi:hypothetical protein
MKTIPSKDANFKNVAQETISTTAIERHAERNLDGQLYEELLQGKALWKATYGKYLVPATRTLIFAKINDCKTVSEVKSFGSGKIPRAKKVPGAKLFQLLYHK